MNHSSPLGRSENTHLDAIYIDDSSCHLHPRVRRHNGLGKHLRMAPYSPALPAARQSGNHLLARKRHTDDSG